MGPLNSVVDPPTNSREPGFEEASRKNKVSLTIRMLHLSKQAGTSITMRIGPRSGHEPSWQGLWWLSDQEII